MKNTILILPLCIMLFSCQQKTQIKKKNSVITKGTILQKEVKSDTIADKDLDTLQKQIDPPKPEDDEVIVALPKKCYAIITLESYKDETQNNAWIEWRYKPKSLQVFDSVSKKQIQEKWFNGIYNSKYYDIVNDIHYLNEISYADFNFDGKMDVAVRGRETGYRNFCYWDFYLATAKGYKFSKSFSKIMNDPIAYLKLDTKNKKITAVREAEFYGYFEYKIQNNNAKLVKETRISRPVFGPFYSRSIELWNGKEMISKYDNFLKDYITDKDYKYAVLSFKIKKSKKSIKIFIDDDSKLLHYTVLKNKESIVDFDYLGLFNYSIKNNLLVFKDENATYKIYETKDEIGAEILENGKATKLIGDIKNKKGSLLQLITMKKEMEKDGYTHIENIVIEK